MLTRVAPLRRSTSRYDPYPPKVESTITHATAPQKPGSVGGFDPATDRRGQRERDRRRGDVCGVSVTNGPSGAWSRRCQTVAAESATARSTGSANAHHGADPGPMSPATTSATPTMPVARPTRWAGVVRSPSSGAAAMATTNGCSAATRAVVPAGTPSPTAVTMHPR